MARFGGPGPTPHPFQTRRTECTLATDRQPRRIGPRLPLFCTSVDDKARFRTRQVAIGALPRNGGGVETLRRSHRIKYYLRVGAWTSNAKRSGPYRSRLVYRGRSSSAVPRGG